MHGVYAHELAVADALRVDRAEPVALLQCEEVHAPLVDVGEVHDQFGRASRRQHVVPQRAVDGHVCEFADVLHRLGHVPYRERVAALEHGGVDLVLLVDGVAQRSGAVGAVVVGVKMVARLDFPEVEHGVAELAQGVCIRSFHSHAHHEYGEGVAVFDFHRVRVEFRGFEAVEGREFFDNFCFAGSLAAVLAGKYGKRQRRGRQKHQGRISQSHLRFLIDELELVDIEHAAHRSREVIAISARAGVDYYVLGLALRVPVFDLYLERHIFRILSFGVGCL